ncbi:unnamed protein product [Rhizoctonia solani]|uniref:CHAT domain-containing protein n=1 Tax=Rhizoctonia solani TaxID=456999 RepID=A0A8H3C5A1_9AGAM|nr:unnamed protein product [Rhizoctonia solani]
MNNYTEDANLEGLALRLFDKGKQLSLRFMRFGSLDDLEKAIEHKTKSILITPEGHPAKAERLHSLGASHYRRFQCLGNAEDLHKDIKYSAQAVALTPEDHSERHNRLGGLGTSYYERFMLLDDLKDLDMAIDYETQAYLITPENHSDWHERISNLGASYYQRFLRLGDLSDLNRAIEYASRVCSLTPKDDPDQPERFGRLGASYHARFNRLGDLNDLEKSLKHHIQAHELTSENSPDYPSRLSNISVLYHERFNHLGDLADLDNAIKYELQSHSLTPENHPDLAEQLSHLGAAYNGRFKCLRSLSDLNKAIEFSLQAISLTPEGHPGFPRRLSHLSTTYYERFICLGNLSDLNKAIEKRLQAHSLTPKDHPDLAIRLGSLGAAYHERFMHSENIDDLQKAIEYKQMALEATPERHPHRYKRLANIGTSYYERYMCQSNLTDLDKAIEYHHQALSFTPEGHPSLPTQLSTLSTSYHQKYLRLGSVDFLNQALNYLRQASGCLGATPRIRLDAALDWARLAIGQNMPQELNHLQAYQTEMELIPEVIWLGITVEERYAALELLNNVVNKASSAAIQDCRYELALEWLEQGRCIVWNQILALRTPLDELRIAHPSIAYQLQGIRDELHRASLQVFDPQGHVNDSELLESVVQRHHRLATQHAALVLQVRQIPGFESFLRPRPAPELVLAARTGPVVVINIHNTSCDALIIRPGDTQVYYLELPYLTDQRVYSMRTRVELSLEQRGPGRETKRRPMLSEPDSPSQQDFKQILVTLWNNLASPILNFLGYLTVKAPNDLPHITWCMTGPLTFLPLHAAGYYDRPHSKLSDYVVSSYTPTLSAILSSTLSSVDHTSILAIGQETTPGLSNLPGTARELEHIKDHSGNFVMYQQLTGNHATLKTVLDGMVLNDWVHLACHAHQNPTDPRKSGFFLHDGILDLSAIMDKSFKGKGLAFLSACQTATGDKKLADEAIHLASGMLIAGYPSVIATMWAVGDSDAPFIADKVYGKLLEGGRMKSHGVARALHHAVEELRKEIGDDQFERWALFIHIGL